MKGRKGRKIADALPPTVLALCLGLLGSDHCIAPGWIGFVLCSDEEANSSSLTYLRTYLFLLSVLYFSLSLSLSLFSFYFSSFLFLFFVLPDKLDLSAVIVLSISQGALVNVADRPGLRHTIVASGGIELALEHLQSITATHEKAEMLVREFLDDAENADFNMEDAENAEMLHAVANSMATADVDRSETVEIAALVCQLLTNCMSDASPEDQVYGLNLGARTVLYDVLHKFRENSTIDVSQVGHRCQEALDAISTDVVDINTIDSRAIDDECQEATDLGDAE